MCPRASERARSAGDSLADLAGRQRVGEHLEEVHVAAFDKEVAFAAFALIIGFGFGPWQIALFGFLDIGGAGWT